MSFSKTPALVALALSVLGFAWIANLSIGEAQAPSDARWTDAAAISGVAGTGELLDSPPIPTPEQIRDRELGMNLANPEVDRNETLDPVAPPDVAILFTESRSRATIVRQRVKLELHRPLQQLLRAHQPAPLLPFRTTRPYIPALGRSDFPLVDGLVLWLVSPVDRDR